MESKKKSEAAIFFVGELIWRSDVKRILEGTLHIKIILVIHSFVLFKITSIPFKRQLNAKFMNSSTKRCFHLNIRTYKEVEEVKLLIHPKECTRGYTKRYTRGT